MITAAPIIFEMPSVFHSIWRIGLCKCQWLTTGSGWGGTREQADGFGGMTTTCMNRLYDILLHSCHFLSMRQSTLTCFDVVGHPEWEPASCKRKTCCYTVSNDKNEKVHRSLSIYQAGVLNMRDQIRCGTDAVMPNNHSKESIEVTVSFYNYVLIPTS